MHAVQSAVRWDDSRGTTVAMDTKSLRGMLKEEFSMEPWVHEVIRAAQLVSAATAISISTTQPEMDVSWFPHNVGHFGRYCDQLASWFLVWPDSDQGHSHG